MKSKDLVVGERYRLRYREFTPTGNCNYGYRLQDGEGILTEIYGARYNHIFMLDNGEQVWATPNSVYEIKTKTPAPSLVAGFAGLSAPDDVIDVQTFLSGLEVDSSIVDDHLVIPPHAISKFKNILFSIYSEILS